MSRKVTYPPLIFLYSCDGVLWFKNAQPFLLCSTYQFWFHLTIAHFSKKAGDHMQSYAGSIMLILEQEPLPLSGNSHTRHGKEGFFNGGCTCSLVPELPVPLLLSWDSVKPFGAKFNHLDVVNLYLYLNAWIFTFHLGQKDTIQPMCTHV